MMGRKGEGNCGFAKTGYNEVHTGLKHKLFTVDRA